MRALKLSRQLVGVPRRANSFNPRELLVPKTLHSTDPFTGVEAAINTVSNLNQYMPLADLFSNLGIRHTFRQIEFVSQVP